MRAAIAIRYNYHVQLVATRRGRMRVANLKFWSAREAGRAQSSTLVQKRRTDEEEVPRLSRRYPWRA